MIGKEIENSEIMADCCLFMCDLMFELSSTKKDCCWELLFYDEASCKSSYCLNAEISADLSFDASLNF